MEIRYAKAVAKYLEGLDKPTKACIRVKILGLTEQPPKGDIKFMQGYSDVRCRLHVG